MRLLLVSLAALAAAGVAAAGTADLATSARTIGFGDGVTLSGNARGAATGDAIAILAQPCEFTEAVQIATAKAGASGRFHYTLEPALNTRYVVRGPAGETNSVRVAVRPQLQVRRVAAGVFAVDVSVGAGQFFATRVLLQRYDAARKRWLPAGEGTLKQNSDPAGIVAVSTARIRAAVKRGTQVRAVADRATLGACYAPATSAPLTT